MVSQAVLGRVDRRQVTSLSRASTVCLVKQAQDVEILMVRRPLTARFMPGVWVFPGGKVDAQDADAPPSLGGNTPGSDWKVAALRELIEETGLWLTTEGTVCRRVAGDVFDGVEASGLVLDQTALTYISNWITPEPLPIRFDTRFFLAVADANAMAEVDGEELIDEEWIRPLEALRRDDDGEWAVSFPTRKVLQMLATETTVGSLVDHFRSFDIVPPIQPRLSVDDDGIHILMPGEPGFDGAEPTGDDAAMLSKLTQAVARSDNLPAEFRTRDD